ncbi:MAG: hypothetical protein ABW217_01790 [Polyangiaceae bacterium]
MRPKANFPYSASAALLLGGGGLWGCVAGVDVSDEELAAISQPVGNAGSSSLGGGGSNGTGSGGTGSSSLGGSTSSTGGTASSTGGTGSNAQGGTGSGGTGNPNMPPPAVGDCADEDGSGTLELSVTSQERAADNQISVVIGVENVGNGFPLSDLVLRYWFSDDDLDMTVAEIDFVSGLQKNEVPITFGEALGSNYFDVGFTSANDIGTGIAEIQIRIHTSNYATVNQANDFSYNAGTAEVINRNISAYIDGVKVFGCEPGSGS